MAAVDIWRLWAETMLHTYHYDVAFYVPGHKRHPGKLKQQFAFTALTQRGLRHLERAPFGELIEGCLYVGDEGEASDVMDHIEDLEIHMSH